MNIDGVFIFYMIKAERFSELREQLVELFPTIKINHWYSSRCTNVRGETVACTGSLYNYYKAYRSELIDAGELDGKSLNKSDNNEG